MASSTKTKVPLNINWDSNKKVWHIMVLSFYIQKNEKTIIASCQLHQDKENIKTHKYNIHRDWLDRSNLRFPDGNRFKNKLVKYPDLNFKNVCSTCVSKTNIKDFKVWLTVQKLKYF